MSLLAVLLAAAALGGVDCADFAARVAEPVPVTVQAISGEALGGTAVPFDAMEGPRWTVGAFLYRGDGIVVRSGDARFLGLVAAPDRGVVHACGHGFYMPRADLDKGVSTGQMVFQRQPWAEGPPSGILAARKLGAAPVLAGYRAGSTWPMGHNATASFVGLMHPEGGGEETLIVAFAARAGVSPARILARLPLRADAVTVLPKLHQPGSIVTVTAVDAEAGYRQIRLEVSDSQVADIAQAFTETRD